ncbi:hypothetical protein HDU92_002385 [Lobulomyces angularis]|nr:hypothetical protein HDU92_002385 [Lobulomyces angularis]
METYEHCYKSHALNGKQSCLWISNINRGPCLIKITHKGQVKDHLITHFSSELKPIQCLICSKRLRNRQELNKHKKINHNSASSIHTSLHTDSNITLCSFNYNSSSENTLDIVEYESPTNLSPSISLSTFDPNKTITFNNQENSRLDLLVKSSSSTFNKINFNTTDNNTSWLIGPCCGIFYEIIDLVANRFNIKIPDTLKLSVLTTYKIGGVNGRIPPNCKLDFQNLLFNANFTLGEVISYGSSILPMAVSKFIIPEFKTTLFQELNLELEKLYQESSNTNVSTYFSDNNLKTPPLKRILNVIVKVFKTAIEENLSNEDNFFFFEPTKKSKLFLSPSDCSGSTVILKRSKVSILTTKTMEKMSYTFLGDIFNTEINNILRLIFVKEVNFRNLCCFGLICRGEIKFNSNFFDFQDEKNFSQVGAFFRLGVNDDFVYRSINENFFYDVEAVQI